MMALLLRSLELCGNDDAPSGSSSGSIASKLNSELEQAAAT